MRFATSVAACAVALAFSISALAQGLPRAQPEAVGMSAARLERVTRTFQDYVDQKRLAGAVILVARDGKVAYLRAFGSADLEAGLPMRDDALFRIASQTKALVSVALGLVAMVVSMPLMRGAHAGMDPVMRWAAEVLNAPLERALPWLFRVDAGTLP